MEKNFASMGVELVSEEYEKLLKEGKALEPFTKACHAKFKSQNDSCMSCIKGIEACGNLSPLQLILMAVKDPEMLISLAGSRLEMFGASMAKGAKKLYQRYGQGPVNVLKKGFNHVAKGYEWMSNTFKKGFTTAFNGLKNAFNGFTNWGKGAIDWVKNFGKGWVKIFTGRRRRYDVDLQEDLDVIQPPWWEPEHRPYVDRKKRDDYGLPEELDAEVDQWPRFRRIHLRKRDDNSFEGTDANRYVPRNKRAKDDELTPAQKQCIKGKCNVCHPFIDATHPGADPVDIWRTTKRRRIFTTGLSQSNQRSIYESEYVLNAAICAVCGADIINKNLALDRRIDQAKKFYAALTSSVKDVLKTIVVDTSRGVVAKIVAFVGKAYVTYHPKGIKFDLWHQDPAYKAIAKFLLGKH